MIIELSAVAEQIVKAKLTAGLYPDAAAYIEAANLH